MTHKYHCEIGTDEGVNTLPQNPCELLDFSLVRLSAGQSTSGNSGDREILAVVLGGKVDVQVGDVSFPSVGGRPNVFSGKPHSVYIPAGSDYTFTAVTNVQIALPSAPSDLETDPYVIAPDKVTSGRWGAANFSRNFHQILTEVAQPELPARRLIVGETYTPSGNWATYPPHRHKFDNLPTEARHEEMYYYLVNPGDGFGISRVTTDEGEEEHYTIRNNVMQMMPEGYHTLVSAPGYETYFLWFLAGEQRTQAVIEDANVGWVSRTVPMLRALGH
jgi:5-deoxy-glucuronate isomerase